MSQCSIQVIAIGNAIVDVMAPCDDALIERFGMTRGGMTLIDTERARELYAAMGPAREISGGSAANTLAGLAALGSRCAFIGQVAADQLGEVFAHDIRAGGIRFERAYLGAGLTAYDVLASSKVLPRHRHLSRKAVMARWTRKPIVSGNPARMARCFSLRVTKVRVSGIKYILSNSGHGIAAKSERRYPLTMSRSARGAITSTLSPHW